MGHGDQLLVEFRDILWGDFIIDDVARSQPREKEREILPCLTWTNQVLDGIKSHVNPPGCCLDHK